jgi:hypothetical protein
MGCMRQPGCRRSGALGGPESLMQGWDHLPVWPLQEWDHLPPSVSPAIGTRRPRRCAYERACVEGAFVWNVGLVHRGSVRPLL